MCAEGIKLKSERRTHEKAASAMSHRVIEQKLDLNTSSHGSWCDNGSDCSIHSICCSNETHPNDDVWPRAALIKQWWKIFHAAWN